MITQIIKSAAALAVAFACAAAPNSAPAQEYFAVDNCCCPQVVEFQVNSAPTNAVFQSAVRTVWRQVPVTSYETRYAFDPTTGYYHPYSQPVTTMQWQAQSGSTQSVANRMAFAAATAIENNSSVQGIFETRSARSDSDTIARLQNDVAELKSQMRLLRRTISELEPPID